MNRRQFVKAAGALSAAGVSTSLFEANSQALPPGWPSEQSGAGWLWDRYGLTLHRVLSGESPAYTEDFLLADVRPLAVRRFTEYSGDLSGRYIGALATASRVYGTRFASLDGLVDKVISLQKPDGYFGSGFHTDHLTDQDLALLWGNGRLLVGLLEYYELTHRSEVLAACRRLGDWLVRIGPLMLSGGTRAQFGAQHFASSYICWMQQTEGLALLYRVTLDERYRRLAEQIAGIIERRPGDHVHGYLTSLRGVMDLHDVTGDARYLQQCEAAWDEIARSSDLLITGGVPEGWSPNNHRTEGCGEADWVRLNLALWRSTEKAKYRDAAERTIFNELAFNQFATGDFGHRLYSETGLPGNGAARAWWCCTLHGLRVFPDIYESVFRTRGGAIYYDFPLDGHVDAGRFRAAAESGLAQDGTCEIKVLSGGEGPVRLVLRKPEWARGLAVRLNGALTNPVEEGGYTVLNRIWQPGDRLEIRYAMELRAEPAGTDRVAYWFGPWLMGAAAADNPDYFNELTADNKLIRGKEHAAGPASEPPRRFTIPVAATETGYIAAEFPDQPGRVTLRAIAEQTGMPTTGWELRLKTEAASGARSQG